MLARTAEFAAAKFEIALKKVLIKDGTLLETINGSVLKIDTSI